MVDPNQFPGLAALNVIWETKVKDCRECRLGIRRENPYPIFGYGQMENPKAVFVATSPSPEDVKAGYPITEDSEDGQLLDAMLGKMGLARSEIFLTFSALCPSYKEHRRVLPPHREACEPRLLAQIRAVRPAVVVALGETAGRSVTGLRPPQMGMWYNLYQGGAKSEVPADVMVTRSLEDMLHENTDRRTAARVECWTHLQQVMRKLQ